MKYWRATSTLGHQTQQHQTLMLRQHWSNSKNKKERWGIVWNLLCRSLINHAPRLNSAIF